MFDFSTFATISPRINEFPIAINADDLAMVCTVWTNNLACHKFHICHIKAEWLFNATSKCKDRSTVTSHQMSVFIYNDLFSQRVCKGFYNTFIFTYTTLKYDRRKDLFTFSDIV